MSLVAYFDESHTQTEPLIYCVAGYIFQKDKLAALEAPWRAILEEYGLDHFHMVDANGCRRNCKHLSKQQVGEMQIRLFDLLKPNIEHGFCVTFDMRLEDRLIGHSLFGVDGLDPYTLCCYMCLNMTSAWVRDHLPKEKVAYFFEQEDSNQGRIGEIMRLMFGADAIQDRYNYADHAFVKKRESAGIQAANTIAWQWTREWTQHAKKLPRRKDLESLLERPHLVMHLDEPTLKRWLRRFAKINRTIYARRAALCWWRARFLANGSLEIFDQKR